MNLLVITQKIDLEDSNLGFFHRWLEKFAQKLDKLYVICLWQGKYNLPQNTIVYSMGKEKGYSKFRQLFNLQKFLLRHLKEVDGVFIHMCPIYAVASYPLVKIFRKKMILWYAHARTSFLAKIIEKLVSRILTPSKESFIYKSKKIIVTGHGIDIETFKPLEVKELMFDTKKTILSIGRIAPIKDLETLIEAINILINQRNIKNIEVKIVGKPIGDYEQQYFRQLKNLIREKKLKNYIKFLGGVSHKETVKFYQKNNIFINMQTEGGAGKSVLEAMACGTPVILCTKTFNDLLGNFKSDIIFERGNPKDLSKKILNCLNFSETKRNSYSNLLRSIVTKNHNLDNLIDKIISFF